MDNYEHAEPGWAGDGSAHRHCVRAGRTLCCSRCHVVLDQLSGSAAGRELGHGKLAAGLGAHARWPRRGRSQRSLMQFAPRLHGRRDRRRRCHARGPRGQVGKTTAERWNGTRWTIQPTPKVAMTDRPSTTLAARPTPTASPLEHLSITPHSRRQPSRARVR
jgi:hypothetical protein